MSTLRAWYLDTESGGPNPEIKKPGIAYESDEEPILVWRLPHHNRVAGFCWSAYIGIVDSPSFQARHPISSFVEGMGSVVSIMPSAFVILPTSHAVEQDEDIDAVFEESIGSIVESYESKVAALEEQE